MRRPSIRPAGRRPGRSLPVLQAAGSEASPASPASPAQPTARPPGTAMPMMKGTSMMSLGTWTARSNKYQTFINVSNVFLLIASTVLLFSSGVLINFYHLTKVKFLMFACNHSPPPPPKIKTNVQPPKKCLHRLTLQEETASKLYSKLLESRFWLCCKPSLPGLFDLYFVNKS